MRLGGRGGVGMGGGISLPTHLTFPTYLLTKHVKWCNLGHPYSGFKREPNVINPKFRHVTSYEFSVYNTDFREEYGLRPCPVLIRIC